MIYKEYYNNVTVKKAKESTQIYVQPKPLGYLKSLTSD